VVHSVISFGSGTIQSDKTHDKKRSMIRVMDSLTSKYVLWLRWSVLALGMSGEQSVISGKL
jgi:hypothetical protein